MKYKTEDPESEMESQKNEASPENKLLLPASIVAAAVILAGTWMYVTGKIVLPGRTDVASSLARDAEREEAVLPKDGVELPVRWGNIGKQLADSGAIDTGKLEELYAERGGVPEDMKVLLSGSYEGNLKITRENSGTLLNLLWAFGLANKNEILEDEMTDPKYGGDASQFASTGGWILAKGDAMEHYGRHPFVALTADEQALVDRVSRGVFRPCCGNSTHFPDCNHGMAMLGLLELMASQGVSEDEMYRIALAVNSYWFPDTYLTIAKYIEQEGVAWNEADPKQILGYDFSSGAGYQNILSKVQPQGFQGGGGCGV